MFDQMLRVLLEYRRSAAPYLEPSGAPAPPASSPPPSVSEPPTPSSEPTPAPVRPPVARGGRAGPELEYVRVLKDGRPIEVGPETIDLRADDIVSLPPEVAKMLVDAQVAERVSAAALRPTT